MIPDLNGNPILLMKKISKEPAIPGKPGMMILLTSTIRKKLMARVITTPLVVGLYFLK